MMNYPEIFLFEKMMEHGGSDLYVTVGSPPKIRVGEEMLSVGEVNYEERQVNEFINQIVVSEDLEDFESTLELNKSMNYNDRARFRINLYKQQQHNAVVVRKIETNIPTTEELNLPEIYQQSIMAKRGLIFVVGPTGSGKSTSLAAMIGYRNENSTGHIITIEDPIEFVHTHKNCIVSQRDVGVDTYSYGLALKNALRQRPDVVLIGEIRDRETVEQAILFAETGHLCVATLHANNSNQAIERVINFFNEEKQKQILLNLSMNLKAIFSQRLVQNVNGGKSIAVEVMLNEGLIKHLIEEGKVKDIKEIMKKSTDRGMRTFDQSLIELYRSGEITPEIAVAEADNEANIRLAIKGDEAKQKMGDTIISTRPEMINTHGQINNNENF